MRFTVKIGGHLLDEGPDAYRKYAEQLRSLTELGHKLAVVIGGGTQARSMINIGRALGINESFLDDIGIQISRINAYIMIRLLPEFCYPKPPTSLDEFDSAWNTSNTVVLGGLTPGQSTTAVAGLIAERIRADRLIILTSVNGVYTDEPSSPNAKLLSSVNIDELRKLISEKPALAGTYDLIDDASIKILKRSHIPTIITSGKLDNIIIDAGLFRSVGTVVTY
ncbi:MAG: UMP kinase [Thermoprotei archaeon]